MITKPKATICACGEPTYKGARCKPCFNAAHRLQQQERRKAVKRKCRCGRPMGAQATRCRVCNGNYLGKSIKERREREANRGPAKAPRPIAQAWPGLRGPGGEWEHGPTAVQGWATLDGRRV